MNRIAWISLMLLLTFTPCLAESPQAPKISIPEPYATYGKEIMEGDVVTHEFTVLNEGNQLLEIKAVRPG